MRFFSRLLRRGGDPTEATQPAAINGKTWQEAGDVLLGVDVDVLIQHCEKQNKNARTELKLGFREQSVIQKLKQYETGQLKGFMAVNLDKPGVAFGSHGAVNRAEASIILPVSLILAFMEYLAHVV